MYRVLYRMYDWGERLMWSLAVLSVPFWLYLALCEASTTQMVAQQQKQDAIWHENHFFCEKHGMPAGTREYTQCMQDLMKIRAQEDRLIAFDAIF